MEVINMKKLGAALLTMALSISVLAGCQSSSLEKIESKLTTEQLEIFEYTYDMFNSEGQTEQADQFAIESNLNGEYTTIRLYVDQDLYLPSNGLDLYKEWRTAAYPEIRK